MVKGLDTFRRYFEEYENQYVLIGGAACDIVFKNNDTLFRATRDLDMVLIVEALTPEFGEKFWKFIQDGRYRNKATNGERPQFYRFDKPENDSYPKNDRIAAELMLESVENLPTSVKSDIDAFIDSLEKEPFDANSLKNYGLKNNEVIEVLKRVFD